MTIIKMITLYAGPAGVMQAGETHDVEPAVAAALIAGKYAVEVKAAPAVVETADLVTEENVETSVPPEGEPLHPSRRGRETSKNDVSE